MPLVIVYYNTSADQLCWFYKICENSRFCKFICIPHGKNPVSVLMWVIYSLKISWQPKFTMWQPVCSRMKKLILSPDIKAWSKCYMYFALIYSSVVSFPPPPLHHYGDSNSGHTAEGEDYEVTTALWRVNFMFDNIRLEFKQQLYQSHVSFSCICPVIDDDFCHNIVK